MKISANRFRKWTRAASASLLVAASLASVQAGTFNNNFDTDPSAAVTLDGTATWDSAGGYVSLTERVNSEYGLLLIPDLDNGGAVGGFTATFKMQLGPGSGNAADGFSFNWGADVPTAAGSTAFEDGAGTGLSICFDTYDNGGGEAPAIDLKVGGVFLQTKKFTKADLLLPKFVDVKIQYTNGLLSVDYNGQSIFANVPIGLAPQSAGMFALGARTGGENEACYIDNLAITTAPPGGPVVQSIRSSPTSVTITLQDQATQVDPSTVKLKINGADVTATVARSGDLTTVTYTTATPFPPNQAGAAEVVFSDTATPAVSRTVDLAFMIGAYTIVPENATGVGTVSTATRGFIAKVNQIEVGRGPGDPNWIANAERQLANGYIDPATGLPYANLAAPGPNADGSYTIPDVINWEQSQIDIGNFTSANGYPEAAIPGIAPGEQDNIVAEVTAFLDLKAGSYRMGVNSDDGFKVSVAPGKEDVFGTVLGSFDGGRGSSDSLFDFVVTKPGKYPFRLAWWEGTGGANVEWFVEDTATGVRTLVNDPASANALVAYANGTGAAWVESALPTANSVDNSEKSNIEITVVNDVSTASAFTLKVNGATVTPTITTSGATTKIFYDPPTDFKGGSTVAVSLGYTDSLLGARTVDYSFAITYATAGAIFIEAEDFNHDGGQHEATADTFPYVGDAYNGFASISGIDFNDPGSAENNSYNRDSGVANANIDYDVNRGAYSMTKDYKVGWNDAGDWYNYTRVFPTSGVTKYLVFGRIASGGAAESVRLDQVTAGADTTTQTLQKLGDFNAPATGGWDTMAFVPLQAPYGDPVTVTASGTITFRATINPNSNEDLNYFMFVPTTDSAPALILLNPAPGGKASGSAPVEFTFQDGAATVVKSSITMKLDGNSVTPVITQNGNLTKVSYTPTPPLAPSVTHTAVVTLTDSAGNLKTSSLSFTTVKPIAGTPPFLQDATGLVVMEVEHNDRMLEQGGHAWTDDTTPGASGGALAATPNSGVNIGAYPDYLTQTPRLDFKVRFRQAGDVYIWVRGIAASGSDDSLHAGLDYDEAPAGGGTARRMDNSFGAPYGAWAWVGKIASGAAAKITVPSAGDHVFNIWMREDGLVLDKIILTTDPAFVPADLGPAESARAPMYKEVGGQVVIEAEKFSNRQDSADGVHRYTVVPDEIADTSTLPGGIFANARGDKYVQVLPENGENRSGLGVAGVVGPPFMEWSMQISTPGDYQLYVRDTGYDGGSDSVYVQIMELKRDNGGNGPDWYRFSPDPTAPDFAGIRNINSDDTTVIGWNGYGAKESTSGDGGEEPAIWNNVQPGIYTIRMAQREDGNAVDAFIFQLASLPPPSNPGPAESALVGVATPPAKPNISVTSGVGSITITWNDGTLQSTPALAVPTTWTDVDTATGSKTKVITADQTARLYRVKQ